MSSAGQSRNVRLSASADEDYRRILEWTLQQFGEEQARIYSETIADALAALVDGPTTAGAKARDEIGSGLHTLHVARNGRRGRHLILFRPARDQNARVLEVLRILHDAMDLQRHIPPDVLPK